MKLSSIQLEAFLAVARQLHFSKAAATLHITQSALSQRIQNLEDTLGLSLFLRAKSGVTLTDPGNQLLRFCQAQEGLERELLDELTEKGDLGGVLRVAGYSSVTRSLLLPRLAPLLKAHPRVQLSLQQRELRDLPGLLERGEADLIVLDSELDRAGVATAKIAEEELVLIEPATGTAPDVYLDHDPEDLTTVQFLKRQGQKSLAKLKRSYLDDIYGILDGVALGLGRAVVSRHLVTDPRVRIVLMPKPVCTPVYLHWHEQPYYPRLHQEARKALHAL